MRLLLIWLVLFCLVFVGTGFCCLFATSLVYCCADLLWWLEICALLLMGLTAYECCLIIICDCFVFCYWFIFGCCVDFVVRTAWVGVNWLLILVGFRGLSFYFRVVIACIFIVVCYMLIICLYVCGLIVDLFVSVDLIVSLLLLII